MERENREERRERMWRFRCDRDRGRDRDTDTDRDNSIMKTQIFVETKSGVTTFQTAGPFNFFCPVCKNIFFLNIPHEKLFGFLSLMKTLFHVGFRFPVGLRKAHPIHG